VLIPAKLKEGVPIGWTMTTGLGSEEGLDRVGWKGNREMRERMESVRMGRILVLICLMNFRGVM
ncbi:hypothetical protein, partial [Bacillus velezensis]|uniref:hypothetical protein n=1 Tax=Bacillus velezensis TaxID=492670 RepID=UPI001C92F81D